MTAGDGWNGVNVRRAREYIRVRLPLPCGRCPKIVNPGDDYIVGHVIARSLRPDLALKPSNWRAEHKGCSEGTGQEAVIDKARAEGARGFFGPPPSGAVPEADRTYPRAGDDSELEPTDWAEVVASLPWMADLAEIPDDSIAPRYMTAGHPDSVGSFGPEFVAWVDAHPSIHPKRSEGLRWFQKVLAYRLLEHDAEGRLVWRNVLITLARQTGKSWLLRALLLWRITRNRDLFGEDATIISIANRMPAARELWRPAARWAVAHKSHGWKTRFGVGDEQIESPEGGRWYAKAATDGVGVGFSLSVMVCDEAWQIPRGVVEAADPALAESASPMLMLVSTAGDSASDLFGTYRDTALAQLEEPTNILIVEWSAPRPLAIDDPLAWRMASPYWSERRLGEVLDKIHKLDELEFRQSFLNQWVDVAHGRPKEPGLPVFTEVEWESLNGHRPRAPAVVAIEAHFGEGVAVATAENVGEQIGVSVTMVDSVAAAADLVANMMPRPSVLVVGKSLVLEPTLVPLGPRGVSATSRDAVTGLRRYADEDVLRHDSSQGLTDQVLTLRTVPGVDGPRVRSTDRLDAVKAVVFAVEELRNNFGIPWIK